MKNGPERSLSSRKWMHRTDIQEERDERGKKAAQNLSRESKPDFFSSLLDVELAPGPVRICLVDHRGADPLAQLARAAGVCGWRVRRSS
jgi:hypothetical protein